MAKVFSSVRNTAVRCDGSGYTACLCIGWRNRQKTKRLHLFVHPMKMGGWEKALARRWRKRAVPVARKAFSIIPNYRHPMVFARSVAMRSGGQRFADAVRIILIMLLAAGRRRLKVNFIEYFLKNQTLSDKEQYCYCPLCA